MASLRSVADKVGSGEEEEIKKGDVCVLLVHPTCTQLGRSYTYIVITDSFQTHQKVQQNAIY